MARVKSLIHSAGGGSKSDAQVKEALGKVHPVPIRSTVGGAAVREQNAWGPEAIAERNGVSPADALNLACAESWLSYSNSVACAVQESISGKNLLPQSQRWLPLDEHEFPTLRSASEAKVARGQKSNGSGAAARPGAGTGKKSPKKGV